MPKPSRPLLHEWMHRFELDTGGSVRVWTQAKTKTLKEQFDQWDALLQIVRELEDGDQGEMIEAIAKLPFVNAAECVSIAGNGRLVYVDWP